MYVWTVFFFSTVQITLHRDFFHNNNIIYLFAERVIYNEIVSIRIQHIFYVHGDDLFQNNQVYVIISYFTSIIIPP